MTNNQTIDGVPRSTIEAILKDGSCKPEVNEAYMAARKELRALLDAPAIERRPVKRYDRDSVAGHCDVEIALPEHKILHCDHGPNLAEALARLAGRVARFHKLQAPSLAAQPQGEPVAPFYICAVDFNRLVRDDMAIASVRVSRENRGPFTEPLYAEQPAPVAVVLPERKTVTAGLLSESNTHNQGWNACLDELSRLNPTRPAHASPPPGTEPSGTHHDNDGLDEWRKPACCGSCPAGCVIQKESK